MFLELLWTLSQPAGILDRVLQNRGLIKGLLHILANTSQQIYFSNGLL